MPEDMNAAAADRQAAESRCLGPAPIPLDYAGAYSWFLTVTPQPNTPTRFTVSVVVCFNRNLHAIGERAVR